MAATVQNTDNIFYGFTEAQVLAARDARTQTILAETGSRVSSFAVNGTSTSFSDKRADLDARSWALHLAAALYELNPSLYPAPSPATRGLKTIR